MTYLLPSERLRCSWRSPAYGFFKTSVKIGYDDRGRKYHFFQCAAKKCKSNGGVRRYQDSKDRSATGNLKSHAIRCFGHDAVETAFGETSKDGSRNGSIFAAFSRQGQQPNAGSHRSLTNYELRAHIARWCVESSRPVYMVQDRQFLLLMKAGRPGTTVPSHATVKRDIKVAFHQSIQRIDEQLKVSI
jgi:hypothetical protein